MSEVMMMPSPWMWVPVLFFPFLLCFSVLNEWRGLESTIAHGRDTGVLRFRGFRTLAFSQEGDKKKEKKEKIHTAMLWPFCFSRFGFVFSFEGMTGARIQHCAVA